MSMRFSKEQAKFETKVWLLICAGLAVVKFCFMSSSFIEMLFGV